MRCECRDKLRPKRWEFKMKSRRVVTRSSRKFCGYYPSKKLGRMVEWESLLERDAILLFEFSRGVKSYQEQPEQIMYEQDSELRRYYPDFSLTLNNGAVIYVEVKPISKFSSLELVLKLNAVIKHYEMIGNDFKILVDESIRIEPRLTNLKRLASVQHYQNDLEDIHQQTIKLFKTGSVYSVQSLSKIIGVTPTLVLIARGVICCNLSIDLFSVVNFLRLPVEADHDALFI